jgi:hypothetical protein
MGFDTPRRCLREPWVAAGVNQEAALPLLPRARFAGHGLNA